MLNYFSNEYFNYDEKQGTWYTSFGNTISFVAASTEINVSELNLEQAQTDKPVYLAVMAHRKQLQPILDNPHLFDPAFVNAVRILVHQYNELKIK